MSAPNRQRRRQPRRHAFRPGADGLERRIAPSADIGVNLDANSNFNGNPIWTDLHNLASEYQWRPLAGSTVSLTANGYPLADAWTSINAQNYPSGNYQFSYTGSGTVSFSYAGQLVGPATLANGVTAGTVAIDTSVNGGGVQMTVTGVDPSHPMDNFHLMAPGYGNGTTPAPMFPRPSCRRCSPSPPFAS
jgi:hypothetical protein